MKSIRLMLAGASLLLLCSCGAQVQKETQVANANESKENAVIETIMSRRSIRQPVQTASRESRHHADYPGLRYQCTQRTEQAIVGSACSG